jgi:hypothetical protein
VAGGRVGEPDSDSTTLDIAEPTGDDPGIDVRVRQTIARPDGTEQVHSPRS